MTDNKDTTKETKKAEDTVATEAISSPEVESAPPKSAKKKPLIKWVVGIVLIIVLLVFVFARGNDMIAQPFIESQLSNVATNLAAQSALSGDRAALEYGDIDVEGGIFNKSAKIKDLKLDYTLRLPFGNVERFVISTPIAVVTADQIAEDAINIRFPEPFVIEREGLEPLELSFDGKPTYHYLLKEKSEEHSLVLPPKAVLAMNPDSPDPVEITITYDSKATIHRILRDKDLASNSVLNFRDIKLTSNVESNEVAIASLNVESTERNVDGKQGRSFKNSIGVTGITVNRLDDLAGPFDLEASIDGDYTLRAADDNGAAVMDTLHMNIKPIRFKADDYMVMMTGEFNRIAGEHLPFGEVVVGVLGLDKFRNSPFMLIGDEALKNKVIKTVTGLSDVTAEEAEFTVKREEQGTLFIGESTFENLIGVIVTHALADTNNKQGQGAAPELPQAVDITPEDIEVDSANLPPVTATVPTPGKPE